MITAIQTSLDLRELAREVEQLQFWLDGAGVHMSNRQSGGIPKVVRRLPVMMAALMEIAQIRGQPYHNMMVNRLPAGVIVPKHRDSLEATRQGKYPRLERWHLPIVTNDGCRWWDDHNGEVDMPAGAWYGPCPYWIDHAVANLGSTERVHLVVDLDTLEAVECGGQS